MHVRRHTMHRRTEKYGIEAHAVAIARAYVPTRRIFYDAGEGLRPVMLYAEGHRVGEEFLERVGRHCLQPVGVDAVHELLESEYGSVSAGSFESLCRHHAGEEPPDHRRDQQARDGYRDRT